MWWNNWVKRKNIKWGRNAGDQEKANAATDASVKYEHMEGAYIIEDDKN